MKLGVTGTVMQTKTKKLEQVKDYMYHDQKYF